jgi:hypothetical protein
MRFEVRLVKFSFSARAAFIFRRTMETSFNSVKHLLTRMKAGHGCGEIAMSEWPRPPFFRARHLHQFKTKPAFPRTS